MTLFLPSLQSFLNQGHDGNIWGSSNLNEASDHPAALNPQKAPFAATDKQETHKEPSCGQSGKGHGPERSSQQVHEANMPPMSKDVVVTHGSLRNLEPFLVVDPSPIVL